jgi:hypothetical protein
MDVCPKPFSITLQTFKLIYRDHHLPPAARLSQPLLDSLTFLIPQTSFALNDLLLIDSMKGAVLFIQVVMAAVGMTGPLANQMPRGTPGPMDVAKPSKTITSTGKHPAAAAPRQLIALGNGKGGDGARNVITLSDVQGVNDAEGTQAEATRLCCVVRQVFLPSIPRSLPGTILADCTNTFCFAETQLTQP